MSGYDYESREGGLWCDMLTDAQLLNLAEGVELSQTRQLAVGQVSHYIDEPDTCRIFHVADAESDPVELFQYEASVERADWADDVVQSRQDSGLPDAVNDGLVEVPAEGVLVGRLSNLANVNARVWMDRVCPSALGDGAHEDYAAVQSMVWEFPVEELDDVLSRQEQDELLTQLEDHMDETMPCPDPEPVTIEDIESGTTALDEAEEGSE